MYKPKGICFLPSIYILSPVKSLKNFFIPDELSDFYCWEESSFLLPPLIIAKNSVNSIIPVPSSSTASTICWTYWRLSHKPKAIRGSSNSSTPIAPDPSSSRQLKYYLSFLNSSSSKSIQCFLPCFFNQFLVLLSGLNINSSIVMTPPSSSSLNVSPVY